MNKFQKQTIKTIEEFLKDKENSYKKIGTGNPGYKYEKKICNHTYNICINFDKFDDIDLILFRVYPGIQITVFENSDDVKLFCQTQKTFIGNLEVNSSNEILYRAELTVTDTAITTDTILAIENEAVEILEKNRAKLLNLTNNYEENLRCSEFEYTKIFAASQNLNSSIENIRNFFLDGDNNKAIYEQINEDSLVLFQTEVPDGENEYFLEISTNPEKSFLTFNMYYGHKSLLANESKKIIFDYINHHNSISKICKLQIDTEGKIHYKLTFSLLDSVISERIIKHFLDTEMILAVINREEILKLFEESHDVDTTAETDLLTEELRDFHRRVVKACESYDETENTQVEEGEINILDISTKNSETDENTEQGE